MSSTEVIKEIYHTDEQRTSYVRLLKIAIPMVVQGLIFTTMLLADRLFVSHYDVNYLAAVSTGGGMATALAFFFSGTIGFANNIVAQYYGAKRSDMLAAPVWAGLIMALFSAVILIGGMPLSQNIFRIPAFNHDEQLILNEQIYFRYIIVLHSLGFFQAALMSFFIGIGQTYKMMITAVAGNVINIIFDWLLIFGIGSFPEMGIAGAGLASVLGGLVSVILAIGFYIHASKQYKGILKPRYDAKVFKRLFLLGAPAGLQMGLEMGGFTVLQLALGSISVATLAASAVSFGLQSYVYAPVVAMASAGAILIGQERGALRMHNFRAILRKVLIVSSIYSVLMMLILWIFPEQLISIYGSGDKTSDPEILAEMQMVARNFLFITGIWLIPDVFFNTYMQTLKALGDSLFLSICIIAATVLLIALPAVALMRVEAAWAKYAIYSMTIVYVLILWLIFGLRYRSGVWKDNHVID